MSCVLYRQARLSGHPRCRLQGKTIPNFLLKPIFEEKQHEIITTKHSRVGLAAQNTINMQDLWHASWRCLERTCKHQMLSSEGLLSRLSALVFLCHLPSLQRNVSQYVTCPRGPYMPFRECSKHLLRSFGWGGKHLTTRTSQGSH